MSPTEHLREEEPSQKSPPPAEPRIALVHDWLTGMRGGEKVLEAIATLTPGAPIHTLFHFPGSVSQALESHLIHTSFLQRAPGLRRYYRHYLPLFPAAVEDLDLRGYDLVVSTSHCVAKGVIPDPHAHHLCYVHTPMRYAWDQERAYFPRRRGLIPRLRGLALNRLRQWDVSTCPRVDTFLANSSFVARRIERYYGRRAEVLPPPVDTETFSPAPEGKSPSPAGEKPFVLAVCALAPYKKLDIAIQACQRLGLELRIVGSGPGHDELARLAGPSTRLLGRVSGEELLDLYRGALCLVQPGVEDFGIAPVEALACGTPVVAQGRGGVLDIVEPGVHGVLYSISEERGDLEVEALCRAIDKVRQIRFNLLDLRRRAEYFSTPQFLKRFRAFLAQGLQQGPEPISSSRAPAPNEGAPTTRP
ncbi:MAG: glycosyltransferase [Acidobacteriota bacterium]